jgi:hypothetical protein
MGHLGGQHDLNLNAVTALADLLESIRADGEIILFDPMNDQFHRGGATGSIILEHLDGRRSVRQIVQVLLNRFAVDQETCEEDVMNFLQELLELRLIRVVGQDRLDHPLR